MAAGKFCSQRENKNKFARRVNNQIGSDISAMQARTMLFAVFVFSLLSFPMVHATIQSLNKTLHLQLSPQGLSHHPQSLLPEDVISNKTGPPVMSPLCYS